MTFEFHPAVRENVPLLIGVAGGTGSGKTYSALLLARGIAAGQPFALVDTENGRAKHYADLFPEMRHGEIHAPFRPDKYADAIQAGAADYPVVVVDSMSHEWAGDGGCLDWHDELMGGDQKKNLSAWIDPKKAHKRMVTRLLQVNAHVILCFRAEPKVEAVRGENGRVEIVPKPSLTGLDGWLPIAEKMLPYELTASFLLMADAPGVPKPIKLQLQHKPFVPLDGPLTEETGRLLAEWARGGTTAAAPATPPSETDEWATEASVTAVLELAARVGAEAHDKAVDAIAAHRAKFDGHVGADWLSRQRKALEKKAPPAEQPAEDPGDGSQPSFSDYIPAAMREGQLT